MTFLILASEFYFFFFSCGYYYSGKYSGKRTFSIMRILTSVDRLLNPANRAHMSLEEQLRELLEKLDLTCAMKSSGSRSKRAKLLKKEISIIRNKLSQQHNQAPQIESGIGSFEEESAALEQDGEEEGKIFKPCLNQYCTEPLQSGALIM